MKCNQIRELIPELAAGFLAGTHEVSQHLSACAECSQALEDTRQTMAVLDEWQVPEPSPYFDVRLRGRLQEELRREPRGWMQWFRKPVLAISFAVLMAASITLVRINTVDQSTGPVASADIGPGTAVGDLQSLDKNHDLYTDFDLLDDLQVQQSVNVNP